MTALHTKQHIAIARVVKVLLYVLRRALFNRAGKVTVLCPRTTPLGQPRERKSNAKIETMKDNSR